MMSSQKQPFALIAGAGVAGLAAAWWLSHAGWRVRIVERAAHLRDGGHMMGLSGPGLATVRKMGLVPRLKKVAYPDMGIHVYRNRAGREILRMDYRALLSEMDWITLRRTELVRILHEEIRDQIELSFGTTVAAFDNAESGIAIQLSDGSNLDADLLVAADGVHSALRAQAFAPDVQCLRPLGYRYAAYDVPDTLRLKESFLSYAEPGLQSEYYTLASGRLAALHVWRSAEQGFVAPQARLDVLRDLVQNSHDVVRAVLDAVEPQADVVIDDLAVVELPRWHSGRVVLLGDSAHSLSLISGQGAGLALASASILAEELERAAGRGAGPSGQQLAVAFARQDQRLRPTVARLQQRSRKLAPAFVPATPLAFHLRNLALRTMPNALLRRVFLNGLKSEAEAMEALRQP
ncbi:FAD-dependent monooxygenase [Acidovorax sacchari]|uniref:FAD-dependent monooxygenase n=1 Tax=Acidovorax sacchari TaxID=3230736 RepID=UPI0039E66772